MIKERHLFLREYNLEAHYFFDPLAAFFFELFIANKNLYFLNEAIGFIALFTIVSCVLVYLNIGGHRKEKVAHSFLLGFFFSLAVYLLRSDGILHLTLFPLLFVLLGASSTSLVMRFFLYIYSMLLSGPLAFIFLLIGLAFQRSNSKTKLAGIVSFICIPVSFLATLFFSKSSSLFDYPRNAQLVPFSILSDMGNACFGPERLPLSLYAPSFHEDFKNSFLFILVLLLPFIVTCIGTFAMKYFFTATVKKYFRLETFAGIFFIGFFSLSIFFKDGELNHSISGILFRCVPGIIWRPYPFLIPGIIIVIFLLCMIRSFSIRNFYANSICTLILFITFTFLPFETFMIRSLSQKETVVYDPGKIDMITLAYNSPSSFFMHVYGDDAETYMKQSSSMRSVEVFNFKDEGACHAISSRNTKEAFLALDGNHTTRWSTKGPQMQGDWFEIVCKTPVSVSKIHLSIVHFKSDFPRGISVQSEKDGSLHEVFHVSEWYGSNQFTNLGLPYFGPQSDVVIDLPREVESNRFRFTLTKGHELFDWSIAKILFLK